MIFIIDIERRFSRYRRAVREMPNQNERRIVYILLIRVTLRILLSVQYCSTVVL